MRTDYTPAGYWDRRYREGRTSGMGSEGDEGAYKATYVSDFIAEHGVKSVIDWGCGDGQVLALIDLHGAAYTGIDVSKTVVKRLRRKFPGLSFTETAPRHLKNAYDLSISMDVLFHLPDNADYGDYLSKLFDSAARFVLIYSTDYAGGRTARHVYRRKFTPDIAARFPGWELSKVEPPYNGCVASFFLYEKSV